MVNISISTLALYLAASVAAIPQGLSTRSEFTISQWVEDIISNPSGTHLSPEEAVAAKHASVAANPLSKRVICDTPGWGRANVSVPPFSNHQEPRKWEDEMDKRTNADTMVI